MFLYKVENHQLAESLLKTIKSDTKDWQMVSLKLHIRDQDLLDKLAQHLIGIYQSQTGMLVKVSDYKIIYFVKVSEATSQMSLNAKLEKELKGFNLSVTSQNASLTVLDHFEKKYIGENANHENPLYLDRLGRRENKVLIIDDDMFVRKVIAAGFSNVADVIEVDESQNSGATFKSVNPDITFVDIHMPVKNGFDVCLDLLEIDPDAYIVMVSSDASIDNLTKSISSGGDGFLAKPIRKEKLLRHADRCVTFSADGAIESFTVSS